MAFGPDSRVYFHHVPKTAGTTVTSWLKDHFHAHEFCPEQRNAEVLVRMDRAELLSYRLFCGHLGNYLFDLLPERPLTVIWLRDPVQQVYSFYRFSRSKSQQLQDMSEDVAWKNIFRIAPLMTFEEYIETDEARALVHNMHERMLGHNQDTAEGRLAMANEHLEESFHIGLVERMDESMGLLSLMMKRLPPEMERKFNVTTEVRDELPREVQKRVAELNAIDFALYEKGAAIFQQRLDAMVESLKASGDLDAEAAEVDSGQLCAASRRRFLRESKLSHEPPDTVFDFTMPSNVEGWRPVAGLKQKMRWSGPGTESSIFLRMDPARDVVVRLLLGRIKDRGVLPEMKIRVNGVEVERRQDREFYPDYDRYVTVFFCKVPASVIALAEGGLSELKISLPYTVFNPELSAQVGLQVGEVSIAQA